MGWDARMLLILIPPGIIIPGDDRFVDIDTDHIMGVRHGTARRGAGRRGGVWGVCSCVGWDGMRGMGWDGISRRNELYYT